MMVTRRHRRHHRRRLVMVAVMMTQVGWYTSTRTHTNASARIFCHVKRPTTMMTSKLASDLIFTDAAEVASHRVACCGDVCGT